MLFLIKPRSINVDLFTSHAMAYNHAPIKEASEFYPAWWKALPKDQKVSTGGQNSVNVPAANMRSCAGFVDLYRFGFILPLWADIAVTVKANGQYGWLCVDEDTKGRAHPPQQAGSLFQDARVGSMKVQSPWLASTKESVYWHLSNPSWNQKVQTDWLVPPANVDFSKSEATELQMLLRNAHIPRDFVIPFATPMVHYLPLDNRPIKLHLHLIGEDEYAQRKRGHNMVSFVQSYYKKLKEGKNGQG